MKQRIRKIACLTVLMIFYMSSKAEKNEKIQLDFENRQLSTTASNSQLDDSLECLDNGFTINFSIKWEGNYIDEFGRILKLSNPKADGEIKFSIDMVNANCQEIFEGTAYLVSSYKAEGSDGTDECRIVLELSNDGITITDNGCSHGSRCGDASGIYKQKK